MSLTSKQIFGTPQERYTGPENPAVQVSNSAVVCSNRGVLELVVKSKSVLRYRGALAWPASLRHDGLEATRTPISLTVASSLILHYASPFTDSIIL